ncbi:MAG: hypothetical protein ACK4E7_04570 [Permianibacter sp.]
MIRFLLLAGILSLLQHIKAAEPTPVFQFGTEYFLSMEQAEAAMRASVANGNDLVFKEMIPIYRR